MVEKKEMEEIKNNKDSYKVDIIGIIIGVIFGIFCGFFIWKYEGEQVFTLLGRMMSYVCFYGILVCFGAFIAYLKNKDRSQLDAKINGFLNFFLTILITSFIICGVIMIIFSLTNTNTNCMTITDPTYYAVCHMNQAIATNNISNCNMINQEFMSKNPMDYFSKEDKEYYNFTETEMKDYNITLGIMGLKAECYARYAINKNLSPDDVCKNSTNNEFVGICYGTFGVLGQNYAVCSNLENNKEKYHCVTTIKAYENYFN